MKIWALIANVDDIVEKYGFKAFDGKITVFPYDVILMDYTEMEICTGEKLKVSYRGQQLDLPDAIFPLITNTDALCMEKLLIHAGCKCMIDPEELAVARSKVATYQRLAQNGIRVPKTLVFFNHPDAEKILSEFSFPFVVKPDNGYGGEGVMLIHSKEEFDRYIENLTPGVVYIAQEYISSSKGKDLRVVFSQGKYVFSIIRQSGNPDEFRSNVHVGGKMTAHKIDPETEAFCKKIADMFDLPIIGIDLLFGEDGFVVTEVNASPGMDSKTQNALHTQAIDAFLKKIGKHDECPSAGL